MGCFRMQGPWQLLTAPEQDLAAAMEDPEMAKLIEPIVQQVLRALSSSTRCS